jgi:hypothetical protein
MAGAIAQNVHSAYPELFHYTRLDGLMGIVKSDSLWATEITRQNDREELAAYFERKLPQLLRAPFERFINSSSDVAVAMASAGGKKRYLDRCVVEHADNMHKILTNMWQPYIVSFCGTNDPREARDGLLSQWRAYGGYAIVLDTKALSEALTLEAQTFPNLMQLGDVHYEGDLHAPPEVVVYDRLVQDAVWEHLNGKGKTGWSNDALLALQQSACAFKHYGFHEEHEVRLVVCQPRLDLRTGQFIDGSKRARSVRQRPGRDDTYIVVHDRSEVPSLSRLPIKRIVVGPSRENDRTAKQLARDLRAIGRAIDVQASGIPFNG